METFDYAAIDRAGKRLTGSITANNAREARDLLRARTLTPLELHAAKARKSGAGQLTRKASHKDLTQASRQLAILVESGTPIELSLKIVAEQFERSPMRQILLGVRARVQEGERLSQALKAYPKTFNGLYAGMVASGEASGKLGAVLSRLADDLEAARKIRQKVLGATIYPIVLSVIAILVTIVLMVKVVPIVVDQFASFGQDLPPLTQATISLSDGLKAYGVYIALALAGLITAFVLALKKPSIRLRWDRFFLKIPVLGKVSRNLNAARFARTMAGLLDSGTPSLQALDTARHTLRNSVMRAAIEDAWRKVREGTALSRALSESQVFPPLVTQMVAGGEASGDIGEMFSKSAEYLEDEFDSATTVFLNLLEPLIIIVLAGIVLLIIAAIFLPILRLNTTVF